MCNATVNEERVVTRSLVVFRSVAKFYAKRLEETYLNILSHLFPSKRTAVATQCSVPNIEIAVQKDDLMQV